MAISDKKPPLQMLNAMQRLAVVSSLLLSIGFLMLVEYYTLRKDMVEELSEQMLVASENASASIMFMDDVAATQLLSAMSADNDIDVAQIYTYAGRKFASYQRPETISRPISFAKIKSQQVYQDLHGTEVTKAIVLEGDTIAYIYVLANHHRLYSRLLWYFCTTVFVLLATILVAYLVLLRFRRAVEDAEQRLDYVESYDPITQLPNRYAFNQQIEAKVHTLAKDRHLGLLVLDLDDFKIINDTLGHHVGDRLLRLVGQRLLTVLTKQDAIYRVGGDEFAVVIDIEKNHDALNFMASQFIQILNRPFNLDGRNLYVGGSVGASVYPQDGDNATHLFQAADTAMYHAKNRGKNQFQLFSADMHDKSKLRLGMEAELREAIQHQQFELYYQPQIKLATGELIGAEALLRWRHPKKGMISPLSFIPLAEETGLIVPIGEWVIRSACKQVSIWQQEGLKPIRVSVNLSARQFREETLVETISNILLETDISPDLLEVEITESVLMDDINATVKRLEAIRLMGVHLAIDDFGTGYSSLSYLKRFPVGRIKIDRSFVQDIPQDLDDVAITLATINMAHGLNLEVVAEGVENQEQRDFLMKHQCEIGQGYLFSKPVDVSFMTMLIRTAKNSD